MNVCLSPWPIGRVFPPLRLLVIGLATSFLSWPAHGSYSQAWGQRRRECQVSWDRTASPLSLSLPIPYLTWRRSTGCQGRMKEEEEGGGQEPTELEYKVGKKRELSKARERECFRASLRNTCFLLFQNPWSGKGVKVKDSLTHGKVNALLLFEATIWINGMTLGRRWVHSDSMKYLALRKVS